MKRVILGRCQWILILPLIFLFECLRAEADISFEKNSNLPIVYLNVVVPYGSAHDPNQQSGITHFVGEMLLRGTQDHTKDQIDSQLDTMGAKLEVNVRSETLIFRGAVLSTQLKSFLSLLTEILTQPTFPETEIKKLKSELISALEEELGHDDRLAGRHFNRFLFLEHPYGNPVLGKRNDIQQFTREKVLLHYAALMQSKEIFVLGSGDATPEFISHWSQTLTAQLANKVASQPALKPLQDIPLFKNSNHRRLLIVDKPDRTQTQINVGQIGIRVQDPDFFALYVANHAFGGPSFSAILMTEIRVKRGWSYGASSSFRYGTQPRSWHYHIFPAEKDTPSALSYSLECTENLKTQGLTSAQFSFAKQSLINSSGFMYNTPKKRIENKLIEKTLHLPDGFMSSYKKHIEKVTLADTNEAIKKFLRPESFTMVVVGTAKNLKAPLAQALHMEPDTIEVIPYTQEQGGNDSRRISGF